MRLILPLFLILAACEENTGPAPAPAPVAALPAPSQALKLNPATPLAQIDCAVDRLPVTGACPVPDPRQFLAVDDSLPLFAPGCIWITREVQTAVEEALIFRVQDCAANNQPPETFAWQDTDYGGQILAGPDPDNIDAPILDIFELTSGLTLQSVALDTLATAPSDERDRCRLIPTDGRMPGPTFELAPNDELRKELEFRNQGDLYSACGTYGVTDAVQLWEQRRSRALFHMLGQDEGDWDPASFTFYKRGGDGWVRDE